MSWYKKSQLSTINVFEEEEHNEKYTNIGHQGIDYDNPNYLWILHDGAIISKKEQFPSEEYPQGMIHEDVWPDVDFGENFSGRFESSTGILSVHRPLAGAAKFRPVPKSILFKLYQKFPGMKQTYIF